MAYKRRLGQFAGKVSRRLNTAYSYGYPYEVQLVPTNACNIHCSQCPKTWYETDNRHLDRNVYERVREQLFPYIRVLNLQGLGEPMISPLFPALVEDAARFDLKVKFVTNGSVMKEAMANHLAEIGADVTVSVDGATAPTHEKLRRGSRFEKILQIFGWMAAAREAHAGSGFSLNINTVVTTMNVDELDELLEICKRYGVENWNLMNPGVGDRVDEFAMAAIGSHPEELAVRLPDLIKRANDYRVNLTYPTFIVPAFEQTDVSVETQHEMEKPTPKSENSELSDRLFPGKCADPWERVYVDVDGWIRPCCRTLWVGMGNILEEDFLDIWNSDHFMRLRRSVNSNCPPSFCRDCPATWGINNGDENRVQKLEERGIKLAPPPRIGVAGLLD